MPRASDNRLNAALFSAAVFGLIPLLAGAQELPPLEPPSGTAPERHDLAPTVDPPSPARAEPPRLTEARSDLASISEREGIHEADPRAVPAASGPPRRIVKTPPPPLDEHPANEPPDPSTRWVGGYWGWKPSRERFTWIPGGWYVPPAGKTWVDGRWKRDDQGWYRIPGTWSDPAVATATNWRQDGPPASIPADNPGSPPGPGYFYIPGRYVPEGDRVAWKSGSWTRSRPGLEWIPARWVRSSDGWAYREGSWTRDPAAVATDTAPEPPATITSVPAATPEPVADPRDTRATERHVVARPTSSPYLTGSRSVPLPPRGPRPDAPTALEPIPVPDSTAAEAGRVPANDLVPITATPRPDVATVTTPPLAPPPPLPFTPTDPTSPPSSSTPPVASTPTLATVPPGSVIVYRQGRMMIQPPADPRLGYPGPLPPYGMGGPPFPPRAYPPYPPGRGPADRVVDRVRGILGRVLP